MNINVATYEKKTTTLTLTDADIIEMLRVKYPEHFTQSFKSSVTFQVPGGGDWSNTEIEIDREYPIKVQIVTETVR